VVVATPGEHRLIPAPCGVSFHVHMLDHLIDVETGEESTRRWSLIRRETPATYAAQKAPSSSAAKGLVNCVAPLCGGRGIASSDFFPSTYGVVIGRRVVGDVELNSPSEPECVL
jgi:hypothetical protein